MAGAPNYFHSDVMQKWVRTISVLLIYHMKKKRPLAPSISEFVSSDLHFPLSFAYPSPHYGLPLFLFKPIYQR